MSMRHVKKRIRTRFSSVQILTGGFALIIFTGALLLMLPISSQSGKITNFLDALFTATSAVCVTGLVTLNTAAHWSIFGQLVIMFLIEIGGLGFMTFMIMMLIVARKRINFGMRLILREAFNLDDMAGVVKLLIYVLKLCGVIQAIGFVMLAFDFVPRYGWGKGLFFSLFHAVSAFCNAGFDLFGNSLEGKQTDSYLILVISALIISGGLGFIVWRDILNYRHTHHLTLHTKIALKVTITLLIGSFLIFLVTEDNLSQLSNHVSFWDRLANTWFLSVTPRTAGFNSVPYASISGAGVILTCFLCFVGGTSGSTAGGLKTTTFGVLIIQVISLLKGKSQAEYAGRTIHIKTVLRAFMLLFISITLVVGTIMILSVTEVTPKGFGIEYVALEVFSAFGTVGMTMGLTPNLTAFGKLMIIGMMFIGRVGIYTVTFSIAHQPEKPSQIKYPEERVMIG